MTLCNKRNDKNEMSCDQEVWVKQCILTAMRMAIRLDRETRVRADEHCRDAGLEGIANGAAVEIGFTLGIEPGFVNLRRSNVWHHDGGPELVAKIGREFEIEEKEPGHGG